MPSNPLRKLFNYAFIAFVDASVPEKQVSVAAGNSALTEGGKAEGEKKKSTDGGRVSLF